MKLAIESTEQLTTVPNSVMGRPGVDCRVWRGTTETGAKCLLFVHRIAVAEGENQEQFQKELTQQLQPGSVVDFRHIL